MWRLTVLVAAALAYGAPLAGAQAKLRAVATLPDLWALTRAVAGDLVTVDVATRPGQNPHDMEIRPSQVLLFKRAQVLIRNGLDEDAWVDPVVEGAGNPKILRGAPNVIEAVRGIHVLKVPSGPIDRSLGDVHPSGNPHFTLDPANVAVVTGNIVAGLTRVAPDLGAALEANRGVFLEKLAAADRRWRETLAPFSGAKVVSYHDSWPYFYRAFGLVEVGIVEDRPGIPPSPQHLAALVRRMKDEKVALILHESWYPTATSSLVARQSGARLLVVPQSPGAVKGTEDYVAHMGYLVDAIAAALR